MSAMHRRLAAVGVLCLAMAACAGPVGTVRVDPKVVLRDFGRSAITTGEPSWPTRNVLYERGLFSVTVNSIVAVEGDGPIEQGDDGVVQYSSAHIEPVESELIVKSSHSTQGNPHTIEAVRRILLLHTDPKTATVPPAAR